MKKIILFAAMVSVLSLSTAFATSTSSDAILVQSIKGDWATDNSNTLYFYSFKTNSNLPGGCGKPGGILAKSGDANINRILQLAYALDAKVKIGVDNLNSCIITTAIVDDSY